LNRLYGDYRLNPCTNYDDLKRLGNVTSSLKHAWQMEEVCNLKSPRM